MNAQNEQAVLSPIRLLDQQLVDIKCELDCELDEYKKTNASLSVETSFGDVQTKSVNADVEKYVVYLHVKTTQFGDDEGNAEIEVAVTVRGMFEVFKSAFVDFSEDEYKHAVKLNVISVLYASARGYVEHITALTPYGKVLLPTINVQRYLSSESENLD